jgi:hypothetical protein
MRIVVAPILATLALVGTVAPSGAVAADPAAARTPVLARDRDRLTYGGAPLRLVGYGDYGILAESTFDVEAFLARVVRDQVNLVRVWVPYHWANDLAPFVRVPGAVPSYRLLQPNAALYDRLATIARAAERRGVVVQVTLFDAVMLETSGANRWNWSPYRDARNVDARFIADAARKVDYVKAGATEPIWRDVQRPLIGRVVDAVGDRGNVIYEVMNEPTTHGLDEAKVRAFHERVVEALRRELAAHAGSKLISANLERTTGPLAEWALAPGSPIDLVSFHVASTARVTELARLRLSRPMMISNDGDVSQWTYAQCPLGAATCAAVRGAARASRTDTLLRETFDREAAVGQRHVEFLDKGLNGATWGSGTAERPPNYDPSAGRLDGAVLQVLARYAR